MKTPERIIIRGTNWLGDSVITIPAVRGLRKLYPSAEIDIVAPRAFAGIWENEEAVDGVLPVDRPTPFSGKMALIRALRSRRYDLGVLFPNSFESALWFLLGGVRRRLGYARCGRSPLLTRAVPPPAGKGHQVHHYLGLVRTLGEFGVETSPSIRVPDALRRWATELLSVEGLDGNGPLIGVNPGASYGEAKCWPRGRFAELIRLAREELGARFIIVGSAGEREDAETLSAEAGGTALNTAGKTTVMQLAALAKRCDIFVSNDSGPMHLACAAGTAVVAIFGPTDPAVTGPLGKGAVVKKDTDCAPCFARTCNTDHRCMTSITAGEVLRAINAVLKEPG